MDDRFIYVFSREDCLRLEAHGYTLLRHDINNNVYIFANDSYKNYSTDFSDIKFATSNVLFF